MNVSAVICTYNGLSKGFLERAILSVLNQTRKVDEIIIIDDGSIDGTAIYIEENFPNVRLISQENLGISAARNAGTRCAKCDLVAYLDDDDVWHPERIEKQLELLATVQRNNQLDNAIIFSPIRIINEFDEILGFDIGAFSLLYWPNILITNEVTSPSGVLISRATVLSLGLFNEEIRIGEDYDLWIRAALSGLKLISTSETLVDYRRHSNQTTSYKRMVEICLKTDDVVSKYFHKLTKEQLVKICMIRFTIICRALFRAHGTSSVVHYYRLSKLREIEKPRLSLMLVVAWLLCDTLAYFFVRRYRARLFNLFFKF